MKARLKLVRLVFSLVVLLVFTSQFRAISAEGDGSADAEGKIKFNKKNEKNKSLKVQKATVNLDQNDQRGEEKRKKTAEPVQEKDSRREQVRENGLDGNRKVNFRGISAESGEEYYKVIVDNNLFRPLGWRPPNNKPRYTLIGTWISSNSMIAKALILEQRSNQTYYVSIGEKVGEATVESIKSDQVSLDLSGDIKMVKSESMQFLSGGGKNRKRGGKDGESKSKGKAREDGDEKRGSRNRGAAGGARGNWSGGGSEDWRGAVERFRNASPEEQQKMREQFMQRMRERGGGRSGRTGRGGGGRGRRGR